MIGRPERSEAAAYYFTCIDRIADDDIVGVLESQLAETLPCCRVSQRSGRVTATRPASGVCLRQLG